MEQVRVKVRFGNTFADCSEAVDPGPKEAQRLYLHYYGMLAEMGAGPQAKALQEHLINDTEFQDQAADILEVNMQGPVWIDAFFRSTCRKAQAAAAERDKQAYSGNSRFGAF